MTKIMKIKVKESQLRSIIRESIQQLNSNPNDGLVGGLRPERLSVLASRLAKGLSDFSIKAFGSVIRFNVELDIQHYDKDSMYDDNTGEQIRPSLLVWFIVKWDNESVKSMGISVDDIEGFVLNAGMSFMQLVILQGRDDKWDVITDDMYDDPSCVRVGFASKMSDDSVKPNIMPLREGVIRLNEDKLRSIIRESVVSILSEGLEAEIEQQCDQYEQILSQEYEQAQKDILTCKPTYHYGLRDALQSKGYTVIHAHDNLVTFYGKSGLFCFTASENSKDWRGPWLLSKKIHLKFENYLYPGSYPFHRADTDYADIRIDDFRSYYSRVSYEIHEPLKIKQYKSKAEYVNNFTKFTVFKSGGGAPDKTIQTYDDFESAKMLAYEIAKTDCKNGKARRDDLSRYYHSEPLDVTKNHLQCILAYETYNCDEHTCYVGVKAS